MTLNASGPISLGGSTVGQSINLELGVSATALASINSTSFRTLAAVPTGQISLSSFYGKSNAQYLFGWIDTYASGYGSGATDESGTNYFFYNETTTVNARSAQARITNLGAKSWAKYFGFGYPATTGYAGGQGILRAKSGYVYYSVGMSNSGLKLAQINTSSGANNWVFTFRPNTGNSAGNNSYETLGLFTDSGTSLVSYVVGFDAGSKYVYTWFGVAKIDSSGAIVFQVGGQDGVNSFPQRSFITTAEDASYVYYYGYRYDGGGLGGRIQRGNKTTGSLTFGDVTYNTFNVTTGSYRQVGSYGGAFSSVNNAHYLAGYANVGAATIIQVNQAQNSVGWCQQVFISGIYGWNIPVFDSSGNIYVTATTGATWYIFKYNSSGTLQWQRSFVLTNSATSVINARLNVAGSTVVMSGILTGSPRDKAFYFQYPTDGSITGTFTGKGPFTVTISATSFSSVAQTVTGTYVWQGNISNVNNASYNNLDTGWGAGTTDNGAVSSYTIP